MFDTLQAGGWLVIPLLICSIFTLAIIIERTWVLRRGYIAPIGLVERVIAQHKDGVLNSVEQTRISQDSALGKIFISGLRNAHHGREIMKESIEETASEVVHELQRNLNALGTVATISPLLGLLGTVVGMIKVFDDILLSGVGDAQLLAGGISQALVTTAAGLTVAIVAVIFQRYFSRRVESLIVHMEQQAIKLVEVLHGERDA
ncbi:MAG: MotA/TolQ/ExbB proton channel family protein [Pontibacterium sp.]